MMALKIANTLENYGKMGKILLIDGSPKFLKKLSLDHLPKNYTVENMQNIILTNLALVLLPEDTGKNVKEVLSESSWDGRIKKLAELYRDKKLYSEEYGIKMCNALVNRMILSTNIDINSFALLQNTPLTLIRPSEASLQEIEDDYGLKQYVSNPIDIKYMEGNHATILEHPKLSEAINSF